MISLFFASIMLLTGCFARKKTDTPGVLSTGSVMTGLVTTGFWSVNNTWKQQGTWVQIPLINTGVQKTGAVVDSIDDTAFDPKKSEDEELDDLMKYIEKVVNE